METFRMPALMTIESMETTAVELGELLGKGCREMTLDASQVERITTPGLQMIVSLDKTLSARDGRLWLTNAHQDVARAFEQTGLAETYRRLQPAINI